VVTGFDLVLFGDPVDHSLSPVIQQAGLDAAGLAGTYRAIRVDQDGFRHGCADLRAGLWRGANVTMPHKRLAFEEMDERSRGAERAHSVNTIVVKGSRLTGHSTDIDGIRQVAKDSGLPVDAPVLVLGAGGAAAAALIAFGANDVLVSSRRWEAAERLAATVDVDVRLVPWGTVTAGAVVVNATPLGMAGETLPPGLVERSAGLLDMAYGRQPTPAVQTARQAGLPCAAGADLLLAQAAASFTLWTGLSAPAVQMRAALQKAQATG
jgi:shikimate dehydrogenase